MKIFLGVIVGLVLLAAVFYGGMRYGQQNNLQTNSFQQGAMAGGLTRGNGGGIGGANRTNRAGGGFLTGEILAQDDKSITLKMRDGGSKIVFLSAKTQISKLVDAIMGDLMIGKNVTINGTANSDGSLVATSIQIVPKLPDNLNVNAAATTATKP